MLFRIWAHLSYFVLDFHLYLIILAVSFILGFVAVIRIFRSRQNETSKKISITAVFSIFFIILVFCFLEAFFRYRYDQSDGLGFLNTNLRWMSRHVVTNTYGYRDIDFSVQKPPGVTRIGVVGDSLTMGYGIKDVNMRFSNLLENKLKKNGFNVQVYNLGESGLDTCSEITEFQKVKQLNFDLIIWEYYPNDVEPCDGTSAGSQIIVKEYANMNPIITAIRKESFLFDFLYWRFSPIYDTTFAQLRGADLSQYKNPKILRQHLDDIATLSATLQQNSTSHKVINIVFPYLFLLKSDYPAKDIHKMIDSYLEKQGNTVIDLLPYLIDKKNVALTVNRFDSHPNEYVHDLAASLLYSKIVPILESIKNK
ncbi:MAG TPA: hypothetical protein VG965_03395 [Patescibacteria group bacterium]|nr:hypothetical protein [Patescibacteria group bacterium]